MVQWLRICLPMQGNTGLIPGLETKIPHEKVKETVKVLSHVRLFVTPWTVARQTPLSMGILQARILFCCPN